MNNSKKNQSDPKQHHFLPQCYLKRFYREDRLAVYFRDAKKLLDNQVAASIAKRNQYYTFIDTEGSKRLDIEHMLADIESKTIPVFRKIDLREQLNNEEKANLAIFLGFLVCRVPSFELSYIQLYRRSLPDKTSETKIPRVVTLEAISKMGFDLAEAFLTLDWHIAYPNDTNTSFITTDNPFQMIPDNNQDSGISNPGILVPGTRKVFPLGQNVCLVMTDRGNHFGYFSLSRTAVRRFNLDIVQTCHLLIIGRDKELIENIVKVSKIDQKEWNPPYGVR